MSKIKKFNPIGGLKYLFTRFKKLDNKTKLVYTGLFVLVLMFPTITLSRYIYEIVRDRYLLSQNFYFYSDVMTPYEGNLETLDNNDVRESYSYGWDGSSSSGDSTIILHSSKQGNSLLTSKSDIKYEFDFCIVDDEYHCLMNGSEYSKETNSVVVSLAKESPTDIITPESYKRTIRKQTLNDSFKISIAKKLTSSVQYKDGDRVTIKVWASSTSPYKENLAGFITYIVKKQDVSYEITDSDHALYATLRLSNSRDGGNIETADISFDPKYVRLDLTNPYYLQCVNDATCVVESQEYNVLNEDITVNGNRYLMGDLFTDDEMTSLNIPSDKTKRATYVKKFTVNIEPLYSVSVNFYKHYELDNYTYNGVGENTGPIQAVFRTE